MLQFPIAWEMMLMSEEKWGAMLARLKVLTEAKEEYEKEESSLLAKANLLQKKKKKEKIRQENQ